MPDLKHRIAGLLLESKAVILSPGAPFTWASGWRAPIYCDNRITLSFPDTRRQIKEAFTETIRNRFGSVQVLAGVATGAIAQGALVADTLHLPFVYVRPAAKEHGRKNQVEGRLDAGSRVLVVEDLVSTGGSSLEAVKALRAMEVEVIGMVAVFSYGFPEAEERFRNAGVELVALTDYPTLIDTAKVSGTLSDEEEVMLESWRKDPSSWGKD